MSMQRLRQLRLYRKLQKDINFRQRLNSKLCEFSTSTTTNSSQLQLSNNYQYRLNNNKKYKQIQDKNIQIERQNKILFNKIQHLKANNIKNQNILGNKKNKNRTTRTNKYVQEQGNNQIYYHKINNNNNQNMRNKYNLSENKQINDSRSRESFEQNQKLLMSRNNINKNNRIKTQALINYVNSRVNVNSYENPQSKIFQQQFQKQTHKQTILFQGIAQIDQITFKIKCLIRNNLYYLIGKNKNTEILLKMQLNQYKKFQKNVLKGNPGKIFQYLQIQKGQIKFRTMQKEDVTDEMEEIKEEQQDEGNKVYIRKKKGKKGQRRLNTHQKQQNNEAFDINEQILRKIQQEKFKYLQNLHQSTQKSQFNTIPDNYNKRTYVNNNRRQNIKNSSSDNQIKQRKKQFFEGSISKNINNISTINNSNSEFIKVKKQRVNSMKKKLYQSPIYSCYEQGYDKGIGKYRLPMLGSNFGNV